MYYKKYDSFKSRCLLPDLRAGIDFEINGIFGIFDVVAPTNYLSKHFKKDEEACGDEH
jgi:hypothetical protein